jgi:uncharacterized integral membrane protein
MGEKLEFQPLTREDKITVVLYRTGIVLSAVMIAGLAVLFEAASSGAGAQGRLADILIWFLFAAVGMSVFYIHLYIGKFKTFLKFLYIIGLGGLLLLLVLGKGSLSSALVQRPASALLLLPLSGCLGFITAKEAFCFKLVEGYLLAMIMPAYLVLVAAGALPGGGAAHGLVLIAAMLAFFTFRKTPMPIAWDIGDKSAYQ